MNTTHQEPRGFELQRELAASPEDLFETLTSPDRQRQWLSALGAEAGKVETSIDLRVGGSWESTFCATPEVTVHDVWTFREVDAPHRIVADLISESSMSGVSTPPLHSSITLTFDSIAAGTLLSVTHTGFLSDEALAFFANVVWPGAISRMSEFTAKVQS